MVDTALLLRKLAALEAYRNQIAEYASIALESYRNDWKVQRIVERTLQMMIETCADIAGHVIADEGLRPADSYADTFRVLGEQQILSPELTPVMEKMAKFRNIVVHQYEAVDAEIVILILNRHLADFDRFCAEVTRHLDQKEGIRR